MRRRILLQLPATVLPVAASPTVGKSVATTPPDRSFTAHRICAPPNNDSWSVVNMARSGASV